MQTPQHRQRFLPIFPRHEQMVVMVAGDQVRGDPPFGQRGRDSGSEPHRFEARIDAERDPRPADARPYHGQALFLADQREDFPDRRRLRRRLEPVLDRVEPRLEPGEQSAEIGLAAQPCALRARVAAIRSLSAFRRMKPAASRWS